MNNFEKYLEVAQGTRQLNESNLAAMLRKINKEDVSAIAIITPYRKENAVEDNELYYTTLKQDLRKNGWGFLQLDGAWLEDDTTLVHEKSVFIEISSEFEFELFDYCVDFCVEYNQDAFLFQSPSKLFGAYKKDGSVDFLFKGKQEHKSEKGKVFSKKGEHVNHILNKINLSDIESMYSALRFGNQKGVKFIFESIAQRNASSMCDAYSRKIWTKG